ncbi:MAG: hypothetical protein VW270_24350 [Candidatus Poseidoniales archaeon]
MATLNNNNRKRPIHQRKPLVYRKGKHRLRPLTLKQLHQRLESVKMNKQKDAVRKEIARKVKIGLVYNQPLVAEAEV